MTNCEKYHDWKVIGVNGTLPYQEVELECSNCGAEHIADFDYE